MKKLHYILLGTVIMVLLGVGLTQLDVPRYKKAPASRAGAVSASTDVVAAPVSIPRTERAAQVLSTMTLEQKVGQLFLARCPENIDLETVTRYTPGGLVLFGRDFEARTPDSLRALLQGYDALSPIPLLFAIDEEGGTVSRASAYSQFRAQKFSSPQTLYKNGGMDEITRDAAEKALFLVDLGINVNLAPVCDVSVNENDFMYARAFGKDGAATAEFVAAVVQATQKNGVGCVLKHFPGYGSNDDTHKATAQDNRPLEDFRTSDFLPFSAGINAGAGCVLVGHSIVTSIDADNPASLSAAVHEVLRRELSFQGVIMTDDLAMGAITGDTTAGDAAVRALAAGNDLLISSQFASQYDAVLAAVGDGSLPLSRVEDAVTRILLWKYDLGLLES